MSSCPPDGSPDSPIAVLGEWPGREELRRGRGFVGPAGKILWPRLNARSILRGSCYVSNWSKEEVDPKKLKPGGTANLDQALRDELAETNCKLVLSAGANVTRALLSDIPEFAGWPIELDWCHGQWFNWRGRLVLPCFNPAGALRDPASFQYTEEDLGVFGSSERRVQLPVPCKQNFLGGLRFFDGWVCGLDTEGTVADPYTVQVAVSAEDVWIGCCDDKNDMAELHEFIKRCPLVVLHNALWDLEVLAAVGIDLDQMGVKYADTMNLAYVRNEAGQSLKTLARRHLRWEMVDYEDLVAPYHLAALEVLADEKIQAGISIEMRPFGRKRKDGTKDERPVVVLTDEAKSFQRGLVSVDPRKTLREKLGVDSHPSMVPWPRLKVYACRDAQATLALWQLFSSFCSQEDRAVYEHDMRVKPYLRRMRQVGLKTDPAQVDRAQLIVEAMTAHELEQATIEGLDINFNSGDQVSMMLTAEGYTTGKHRTKKGRPSTGKKGLKAAEKEGSRVGYFTIRVRELSKVSSTYLSKIPGFTQADGRIHPRVRDTRVPSGRLATHSPNLMAFPKRSDIGLLVRSCVVAEEGRLLGSWDLSQIELRVLAHESQDERMVRAFLDGLDLHQQTADNLKIPRNPCAKVMNFMVVYGGGPEKFLEEMAAEGQGGWDLETATQALRDWFKLYPGVAKYRDTVAEEMRETGGTRDRLGRFRRLPAIYLTDWGWPCSKLREEAIRQGVNHKIQGQAQAVIKDAMVRVWQTVLPTIQRYGYCEPLLQIHDELLLEFESWMWGELNPLMLEALCAGRDQFCIPILAEGKYGQNWAALK